MDHRKRFYVSDEFIKYVTPLVQGSVNVPLGERTVFRYLFTEINIRKIKKKLTYKQLLS